MRAAVYAREILGDGTPDSPGQYDCAACSRDPQLWDRRGRCVGPVPERDSLLSLRIERRGAPQGSDYGERFDTCPRGLLRADLRPREVAVAQVVSQAAAADVDKRWPDVPARLYGLLREWRGAEADRMRSETEAMIKGAESRVDR